MLYTSGRKAKELPLIIIFAHTYHWECMSVLCCTHLFKRRLSSFLQNIIDYLSIARLVLNTARFSSILQIRVVWPKDHTSLISKLLSAKPHLFLLLEIIQKQILQHYKVSLILWLLMALTTELYLRRHKDILKAFDRDLHKGTQILRNLGLNLTTKHLVSSKL